MTVRETDRRDIVTVYGQGVAQTSLLSLDPFRRMTDASRSRLAGGLLLVLAVVAAVVVALHPWVRPRNVVIFVADGLRSGIVDDATAPEMAAVRRDGVDFHNSHSLYPTVTTPNASAIATGHYLGDTGDFGNAIWVGAPTSSGSPSLLTGLEDDEVLGNMNKRYGGDYLGETSLLAAARAHGFSTAVVGKLGPAAIQDVTDRDGKGTILIDDSTGKPGGIPLADDIARAIKAIGLDPIAEDRGLNGDPGDYSRSGVHVANVQQQNWFVAVATKVLLPRFKQAHKPFVLVFWSRDPDGTQHFNGDSLNSLKPGINGPTTLAGIRNADNDLKALRDTLKSLGLDKTTDVVITADHGFSVASKESATSPAARIGYRDVVKGFLPRGFLAIDLAMALGEPLFDGNGLPVDFKAGEHSRADGQLIGKDAQHPDVAIAPNGGSDLIYLFGGNKPALARKIVAALLEQDYTGGILLDDALGAIPGTLPMSAVGLKGSARTPQPSIIVGFKSFSTGCAKPEVCVAEVADTEYQQGQGIHGSFSRADTHNFMAAIGPDFKGGYVDPAPVSNADWAPTLRHILHLAVEPHGALRGRVMAEALKGGREPKVAVKSLHPMPASNGFATVLNLQMVGGTPYFDAAGAPGRVFGLKP
jgi:arylsulfatase A-like enzyme